MANGMKPGLPVSIALHAAVLGWALVSFASTPPMEAPASDPIDVELLPPSQTTQQKLGSKTGKPSDEIKKETAAAPKETTGNRAGNTKSEEPPPPPPEQKPTPPAEKPQEAAATPPVPEARPEPPKPDPPKQVAEVKPPPPPTSPPPPKPEPAKEPDKPKEPAEKPVEVKPQPPKDEKALERLLEKTEKAEKQVEKKPETPKPPKTEPVKMASNDPKSASTPTQKPSNLRGQQTDIVNRVETGTNAGKAQQHASLGNPTGPAANVKLSQSELEGLIGALRAQITKCWNVPPGASESGVRVTLVVELNPDGTLRATPTPEMVANGSNPMAGSIVSSAVRAVKMCASQQPFKLPADKYGAWAVNHITFDPKTM